VLETLAGPEIGVASTKAFTAQLTVLAAFTLAAGRARGVLDAAREAELTQALMEVPGHAAEILAGDAAIAIAHVAERIAEARDVLYLGRGASFPVALEGALKLKEITYIHAEAYAAGEMKHGPIALIDRHVPVVVIAPSGPLFEKTASNLQEAAARGGQVIVFSDQQGAARLKGIAAETVVLPGCDPFVAPILHSGGAAAGLSRCRAEGHGCRPAAQPRQIGDRGISAEVLRGRLLIAIGPAGDRRPFLRSARPTQQRRRPAACRSRTIGLLFPGLRFPGTTFLIYYDYVIN
jgi:fructoselysine-6-P-deglycase FrlB-like protein